MAPSMYAAPLAWARALMGAAPRSDPPALVTADVARAVVGLGDADIQALFGFVRRLGLRDEQADDAVQEVLVRLLEEQRRGVVIDNPRAWAYRSIYRLAMDQHRLRTRIHALVTALGRRPPRSSVDVTDRLAVWAEVDRLSLRQRQVIYLRYRSDLDFPEIAHALAITPSAARSHATQAIARLRSRLGAESEEDRDGS